MLCAAGRRPSRTTSRPASPCWCSSSRPAINLRLVDPRAARGDARRELSAATGPGYLDIARARRRCCATRRASGSPTTSSSTRTTRGSATDTIVATRVSLPSDRSFASLRQRRRARRRRRRSTRRRELDVEAGDARRRRSSIRSRPTARASRSTRCSRASACARRRCCASSRRRRASARSSTSAIRDSSGSTRAGTRRRCSFVQLGFEHILDGIDHLLFVLCLVIPFRRIRPLVAIVTSFTVAHSITLIASALGFAPNALWFPPLIEVLIALSIVYMALENIVGAKLERRWLIAFGFGLVHGFGFSFALRESLQFAGSHLATSLLSFNVGVELGQLVRARARDSGARLVLFTHVVAERMGTIILSAFVAHTAWHWMLDRGAVLGSYHVRVPALDPGAARRAPCAALMLLLIVSARRLGVFELYGRLTRGSRPRPGNRRRVEMMRRRVRGARWSTALASRRCGLDFAVLDRACVVEGDATLAPRQRRSNGQRSTLDGRLHGRAGIAGQRRLRRHAAGLPHAGVAHRRRRSPSGGAGSNCRTCSRSSARGCRRTIRAAWRRRTSRRDGVPAAR